MALGASAGRALLGSQVTIRGQRGEWITTDAGYQLLLTVHPSYLLRLRGESRAAEYELALDTLARAEALSASEGLRAGEAMLCWWGGHIHILADRPGEAERYAARLERSALVERRFHLGILLNIRCMAALALLVDAVDQGFQAGILRQAAQQRRQRLQAEALPGQDVDERRHGALPAIGRANEE